MFGVTALHAQIAIIYVHRTLVRGEARYLTRLTYYTCRNPLYVRSINVKPLAFNALFITEYFKIVVALLHHEFSADKFFSF